MSETEHIRGKLKIFPRHVLESPESFIEYIQRFFVERNQIQRDKIADDEEAREIFYGIFYKTAVLVENIIYEIIEERDIGYDDVFEAHQCPDGTIDFTVKYDNGGCSFNEAIERALKDLPKG